MKKILLGIGIVVLLTGCGSSSSSKGTNAVADISIEEGSYVMPLKDMGTGGSDEYVLLNVKVKNNSKNTASIMDADFVLIEKGSDKEVKAQNDYKNDLSGFEFKKLGSEKSTEAELLFNVDSEKEYELQYTPSPEYDAEGKDSSSPISVAVTLDKYEDSKKTLEQPIKAAEAYIDEVFLGKANKNYEKYVGNDLEIEKEMVNKDIDKMLKDQFYSTKLTDEQIVEARDLFVTAQGERVEYTTELGGNIGDVAVVLIEMKGISNEEISAGISEKQDEYEDKTDSYDYEKRDAYAFSKLNTIFSESDLGQPRDSLMLTLELKEEKWVVNLKSDTHYENEYVLRAFTGDLWY